MDAANAVIVRRYIIFLLNESIGYGRECRVGPHNNLRGF